MEQMAFFAKLSICELISVADDKKNVNISFQCHPNNYEEFFMTIMLIILMKFTMMIIIKFVAAEGVDDDTLH
jgi:hypothetical protein